MERHAAAAGWLEHLPDRDLALLARVAGRGGAGPAVARLRAQPGLVEELLADPATYAAVFERQTADPLLVASPFLVFALAVARTAAELETATFVPERVGPRQRVVVFEAAALRGFLASSARRLFLAELLASYVHLASGSVWVRTGRGWRRRRYNELDPVRLAGLLDVVPEADRAGIWRRLGDLALFLTGVFPDHAGQAVFGPVRTARLRRAAGLPAGDGPDDAVALLEHLGRRWYRLAGRAAAAPTAGLAVVGEVADRFGQARRVLNLLTDRHLFAHRARWFPGSGGS
jgi:hypothetical protein